MSKLQSNFCSVWEVVISRQGVRQPYQKEVEVDLEGKSYKIDEHNRDDGLWLSTEAHFVDEEKAQEYYEREVKRFELKFYKHRYFKVLSGEHRGVVFIESDYDGCMHYARLPGEVYTTRMWDNECVEVMDYDGTPFPKPITGYYECDDLMCPHCDAYIKAPDWTTDSSKIYKLDCPECEKGFELTISMKVTYTTSTDVDAYMDSVREDKK